MKSKTFTTAKIAVALATVLAATPVSAATFLFASVRANGTVISKSSAVTAIVLRGTGRYEVRFKTSMQLCAVTATPKTQGDPYDIENVDQTGKIPFMIQTAWTQTSSGVPGVNLTNSVNVLIHKRDGTRANAGFDMVVACP